MLSAKIVDSDAFLDMPQTSQLLYFHLAMRVDDDGFVGNHKKIMRMIGSADNDIKILFAKSFIIGFDNGVIVIKHHRMNNNWDKHNCKRTQYIDEFQQLNIKENGAYTLNKEQGTLAQSEFSLISDGKKSLEENRIEENRREKKKENSLSYLKKIPEEDLQKFYERFDCSKKLIQDKGVALHLWCETNGKRKKNYRAFLLTALRKDFKERTEPLKNRKVIMVDGKPTVVS